MLNFGGETDRERPGGGAGRGWKDNMNPLNTELNPICHLLTLLGAHHIFHISGLRVNPYPANV